MTQNQQEPLQDSRIRSMMDEFAWLDDWESRYAHLIALGKTLEPLADDERIQANKVQGCASQVWLVTERDSASPPTLKFRGDSDAMIVRGLIALLVRLFSDRPAEAVLKLKAREVFDKLGLSEHLSSQRSNGLVSMVERLRQDAHKSLEKT